MSPRAQFATGGSGVSCVVVVGRSPSNSVGLLAATYWELDRSTSRGETPLRGSPALLLTESHKRSTLSV